jgi:hypothetical protein
VFLNVFLYKGKTNMTKSKQFNFVITISFLVTDCFLQRWQTGSGIRQSGTRCLISHQNQEQAREMDDFNKRSEVNQAMNINKTDR